MRIIEKITIKHFRSFDGNRKDKKQKMSEIINLKDLNIFSGANDSGKSNVLRALNLFFNDEISPNTPFNWERDLSKSHKARSAKDKKNRQQNTQKKDARERDLVVKIKIDFLNVKRDSKLPKRFYAEKTWGKSNQLLETEVKVLSGEENRNKGHLTNFINSIKFNYVPAVKDRQFFNFLFQELQNHILKKEDKRKKSTLGGLKEMMPKLEDTIKEETKKLFNDFKESAGVDAQFALPKKLVDFFATLRVKTSNDISLFDRGDGIQARFIPAILNEISSGSERVIWAFEEPESSYETLKCFEFAQDFLEFSQKKQIFITSHAFPFIALKGEGVSSYRVKKEEDEDVGLSRSLIGEIDTVQGTMKGLYEDDEDSLHKELGIIELYEKLSEELDKKLHPKQKKQLFVEDEITDIYKISWLKLKGIECDKESFSNLFEQKCDFEILSKHGKDELKKFLDPVAMDESKGRKIIGLFDFDAAFNTFNGLNKNWSDAKKPYGSKETCLKRKREDCDCVWAILIPVPESRRQYVEGEIHHYLDMEHLFEDSALEKVGAHNGTKNPGGGIDVVQVNKKILRKNIFNLEKEDFKNFEPLFKAIDEIFNNQDQKTKTLSK